MMLIESWCDPDSIISCDASLVGCGGWCELEGRYFHATFPPSIVAMKLSINSLELLTIVITLKLWGSLLANQQIIIKCDNMSSVQVVNSGFSRDSFHQSCLREICYFAAINNFCIKAVHVKGVDNRIPDMLLRS